MNETNGEKTQETLDAHLRSTVESGELPGVTAMVTTSEDTVYQAGFGETKRGSGLAMTLDSVMMLASMTKPITGLAAMILVERGDLALDAPARDVLTEVDDLVVLEGWDDNDKPIVRAPKKTVTLRHFLTHTSGLSYEFWNADIGRYQEGKGIPGIITQKNAALFTPMIAEPGEKFEYGISMDWAGKMVEAVSGQRLSVFMRENIFGPLGMPSTAFKITPDMETRRAWLHTRGDDGALEPYDFVKPQDPEFEEGGGGLYSTCRDYTRFMRMMLNKGELDGVRIISPETVALMSRNAIGDVSVGPLKTVMPDLSNDCEFFPGQRKTWGLSFMINEEKGSTGRTAGSLSWAGLSNVYFWIDPEEDIAGTFMTQMLPFADGISVDAFLGFEKKVYELKIQGGLVPQTSCN